MLPNLIVIGAMKSGTTSLHYYLNLHSEITMTQEKELNFFISEKNWKRGIGWYESHFSNGVSKIRGESSPDYTKHPLFNGVPARMYSIVPDAKLIYILRDPIDRIVSNYIHNLIGKRISGTIEEVLENPQSSQLVANSKYYMQLKEYLKFYSLSTILIITLEELENNPQRTLQKVFKFLEVDDTFYSPQFTEKLHLSSKKRAKNWLGNFLTKHFKYNRAKNEIRARLPLFVNRAYVSLTRKPNIRIEKPVLDDNVKCMLIDELKGDVDQLRKLTGNDFKHWCL